jgi:hypothetical protein
VQGVIGAVVLGFLALVGVGGFLALRSDVPTISAVPQEPMPSRTAPVASTPVLPEPPAPSGSAATAGSASPERSSEPKDEARPSATGRNVASAPAAVGTESRQEPVTTAAAGAPSAMSRLVVSSEPPGRIRINGRLVGTSPIRTEVPPGLVEIKVSGTGFHRVEKLVLEPGEERTRAIVLEKGWLQTRGRPEDAIIRIDGRELGARPESQEVYEGVHRVEAIDPETRRSVTKECVVLPREYKLCKFEIAEP